MCRAAVDLPTGAREPRLAQHVVSIDETYGVRFSAAAALMGRGRAR